MQETDPGPASCPQVVDQVGAREQALVARLEQRGVAKQEWDQDLAWEIDLVEDAHMDAARV